MLLQIDNNNKLCYFGDIGMWCRCLVSSACIHAECKFPVRTHPFGCGNRMDEPSKSHKHPTTCQMQHCVNNRRPPRHLQSAMIGQRERERESELAKWMRSFNKIANVSIENQTVLMPVMPLCHGQTRPLPSNTIRIKFKWNRHGQTTTMRRLCLFAKLKFDAEQSVAN